MSYHIFHNYFLEFFVAVQSNFQKNYRFKFQKGGGDRMHRLPSARAHALRHRTLRHRTLRHTFTFRVDATAQFGMRHSNSLIKAIIYHSYHGYIFKAMYSVYACKSANNHSKREKCSLNQY